MRRKPEPWSLVARAFRRAHGRAGSPEGLRDVRLCIALSLAVCVAAIPAQPDARTAMLDGIEARAEFERRGAGFVYKTRLADRKPALDYRK